MMSEQECANVNADIRKLLDTIGELHAELAATKADLSTEKDAHREWKQAYFDK